jgi:outer membrane receptor protein involved in Fe transport
VLGNAELQPETGLNRDVGFIATWPRWRWLDGGHLQYAFFYNDVHDLIAFEQANPRQFRPFNIGNARIDGSEVSLGAGVLEHAGLELNYTHQNSADLDIDSPEGNQLPLRPADELFVQPRLFADKGAIYYQYTYLSANPTDADNFEIVPSRSIHTVGLSVQTLPWLSLRFEAVNLGNADVRDLGDFPLPGLSFFGGAQAVF